MYTLTPAWEIHFHLVYTLNSSLVYSAMPGVNPKRRFAAHKPYSLMNLVYFVCLV